MKHFILRIYTGVRLRINESYVGHTKLPFQVFTVLFQNPNSELMPMRLKMRLKVTHWTV